MFSPIKWLKPRLRSLCVAFGIADMTLILLSVLGWYFLFDTGYRAQHNHHINEFEAQFQSAQTSNPVQNALRPTKEEMSAEALRVHRTLRACGFEGSGEKAVTDKNLAGPAALIGAAMGGYFILGALLASLSIMKYPTARKVACTVCLMGEGMCTLFIIIATVLLVADETLCPTEYYFESFQIITFLLAITLVFIFSYKTYEVTIIAFYLSNQSRILEKEALRTGLSGKIPTDNPDSENNTEADTEITDDEDTATKPKSPGVSSVNREKFYSYVDGNAPENKEKAMRSRAAYQNGNFSDKNDEKKVQRNDRAGYTSAY